MAPDRRPDPDAARRVLIVEDEGLIAMLMEDMLADLGHEVAAMAEDLEQALAMARRKDFDVAILDLNLNGKDIYPVAEILSARRIPFAFATGYGQLRLPAEFQDRPVLQKPFQAHDLEAIISQLAPSKEA